MKVYTRRGDDGTTSLGKGGRVPKDDRRVELLGALDEAQAFLGLARAECEEPELSTLIDRLERELWVLMSETAAGEHPAPNGPRVGAEMVAALEAAIDERLAAEAFPTAFSVPGDNRLSATLDVARTVVRRAERLAVGGVLSSPVARAYLNRLSDLCWVLARSAETTHETVSRRRGRPDGA